MSISDPTKPWAIVLCSIEGSSPPASTADVFRALFTPTGEQNTIADFWTDATEGTIDVSHSDVFGWYDSGFTMIGTTGLTPYPGVTGNFQRPAPIDHARAILEANNPGIDVTKYRSILGVYNFGIDGGYGNGGVAYGLALGSGLTWAQNGWKRCTACSGLIRATKASAPCAKPQASHTLDTSDDWLVSTSPTTMQSQSGYSGCSKCGVLFDTLSVALTCPAGGTHSSDGSALYALNQWQGGVGDGNWFECFSCGMVVRADASFTCPATGKPHRLAPNQLNFLTTAIKPGMTWLGHEMGHAFGFVHSRSSQPDTTDIGDDCLPGAYGDHFDIMSAMPCDHYPDATGQPAGPMLAVHHLLDQGLIPSADLHVCKHGSQDLVVLRPADSPQVAGAVLLQAGDYLVEFRMHARPDGSPGWDRALNLGGATSAVIVRTSAPPSPILLRSTRGNDYLVAGDVFEGRAGLSNPSSSDLVADRLEQVRFTVDYIDEAARQAFVRVEWQNVEANAWQRWLVLPCTYQGDPKTAQDLGFLSDLMTGGVEGYWNDVSGGASLVRASYVLSAETSHASAAFKIATSAADAGSQVPITRVQGAVDAVRGARNPTNAAVPLFLDWRWFTGIIIASDLPTGGGYLGKLSLPSSNMATSSTWPDGGFNCAQNTHIGNGYGALAFDVIEVGKQQFNSTTLNHMIGLSLGLTPSVDDPYHLVSADADVFTYTSPGDYWPIKKSWGASGPFISADDMGQLNWLGGRDFTASLTTGQNSNRGTIRLSPLSRRSSTSDLLRATIGPLSFECRVNDSWDAGLPNPACVLACADGDPPRVLQQGDSVAWTGGLIISGGSSIPATVLSLLGGGVVSVQSLDQSGAVLDYSVQAGRRFVERVPWQVAVKVPPGDPWGGRIAQILEHALDPAIRELVKVVRQEVQEGKLKEIGREE